MSPIITVTLPSDGDTALAENIDDPITAILAVVNGNLDDSNIASVNGSKIVAGTIPPSALNSASVGGWNPLGVTLAYASNNGNREFTATATGNFTTSIQAGYKFQVTRGTPPNTTSMSFNGSSQSASVSSPTGLTFTGPFTCETWIYPMVYNASTSQYIMGREDGTQGWGMYLNPAGQVTVYFGTSSSFTNFVSSQSVNLNRWNHIAGVVTSVSGKAGQIYIDGVPVPTAVSGTATTLTQPSTAYAIGYYAHSTNQYFQGYLAEVRVWSQAQSQSAITANQFYTIPGSTSGLVGYWIGNSSWVDSTSNANTLTPGGSAINTQAANPFNAIENFFVTGISYNSGSNTTTFTLFGGKLYSMPATTLTLPQYSNIDCPFGFQAARQYWGVTYVQGAAGTSSTSSTFVQMNSAQITIPTGIWNLEPFIAAEVSTGTDCFGCLYPSTTVPLGIHADRAVVTTSGVSLSSLFPRQSLVSLASMTAYMFLMREVSGGTFFLRGASDDQNVYTYAEATLGYA